MATIINPSLFSWNDVEARSDLDRFYLVRDNLPDEKIVMELEDRRGKGRDEFPVRAMWNAIIAGVVFQHVSIESLIRELSRNPAFIFRLIYSIGYWAVLYPISEGIEHARHICCLSAPQTSRITVLSMC